MSIEAGCPSWISRAWVSGDLQLRFQLIRLHHLGQHGAQGHVLTHGEGQTGQHPGYPRARLSASNCCFFKLIDGLSLVHLGLLYGEL